MRMTIARSGMASAVLIVALAALPSFAGAQSKEKIARLSFGDFLEFGKEHSSRAGIEESFKRLRDSGITTIWWRMLWEGHPIENMIFYSNRVQEETYRAKKDVENTPYAWDPHEIRWPIEVAHRLNMKFYAWIVVYNEGAPPGTYSEYGLQPLPNKFPYATIYEANFPYQSKFVRDHPECQLVDRDGKRYHYGVLEWAYPEARQYWLNDLKLILDKYDVDGIYIDTRTECMSPQHADQYGFNEPVVKEYQKRYGVNILQEDFDVEQWRALRGEYFTLLLREMSQAIHAKGKLFTIGTSRGDYVGFPLGNMKLEWRKWISEKIVDGMHVDIHGNGFGKHGYGYVTDAATGRGLQRTEDMVRDSYGPLAKKYGVKLYSWCGHEDRKRRPERCKAMAAMPEFSGTIE